MTQVHDSAAPPHDKRAQNGDERPALNALQDRAEQLWPAVTKCWSQFMLLRPPAHRPLPFIAQIDLKSRAVLFDGHQILDRGLESSLFAILAHEVGHHAKYPGELSTWLRLLLLENENLPAGAPSVLNLFSDLCINTELAHATPSLAPSLAAVYAAYKEDFDWTQWPALAFALTIYAQEWNLPVDEILHHAAAFHAHYPQALTDAKRAREALFPPQTNACGGSLFERFLCFLHLARPYLEVQHPSTHRPPPGFSCCPEDASDDDWARVLDLGGEEERAIDRAEKEGWREQRRDVPNADTRPFERAKDIAKARAHQSAPSDATSGLRPFEEGVSRILAAWYIQQAASAQIRLPPSMAPSRVHISTTTSAWEPGAPLEQIDWTASTLTAGQFAGGAPVVRDLEPDDDEDSEWMAAPALEIFLDVSGSMPNPNQARNPMTLAALMLGRAALAAHGTARVALFSSDCDAMERPTRSERELANFLLRYSGYGTRFPVETFDAWLQEQRAPTTRVLLTDSDLVSALRSDTSPQANSLQSTLARAATQSRPLLVLVHDVDAADITWLRSTVTADVIDVGTIDSYVGVAASLSRALYPHALAAR